MNASTTRVTTGASVSTGRRWSATLVCVRLASRATIANLCRRNKYSDYPWGPWPSFFCACFPYLVSPAASRDKLGRPGQGGYPPSRDYSKQSVLKPVKKSFAILVVYYLAIAAYFLPCDLFFLATFSFANYFFL